MSDSKPLPTIAIVDDDSIFQFTASKTIATAKLASRVLQFENGEEAILYLKENALNRNNLPDFLFLDINMPLMDGWMFMDDYSKIGKSLAKDIQIFMVSSSIDPRDIDRARKIAEIREYITKPVTIEKFVELLRRTA